MTIHAFNDHPKATASCPSHSLPASNPFQNGFLTFPHSLHTASTHLIGQRPLNFISKAVLLGDPNPNNFSQKCHWGHRDLTARSIQTISSTVAFPTPAPLMCCLERYSGNSEVDYRPDARKNLGLWTPSLTFFNVTWPKSCPSLPPLP